MSRLELPALLATPLRPALGSAAETRSANICAKRSTKASNGCEECLAIWPHYSKKGWRCKLRTLPRSPIILFDGHPPGVSFRFPLLVVSPDLRLQHLLLFLRATPASPLSGEDQRPRKGSCNRASRRRASRRPDRWHSSSALRASACARPRSIPRTRPLPESNAGCSA